MKQNLETYLAAQPFVGLCISVFLGLLYLLAGIPWSVPMLLYLLLPFIVLSLICLPLFLLFYKRLHVAPFFVRGIWRYVTAGLLFALLVCVILLYLRGSPPR